MDYSHFQHLIQTSSDGLAPDVTPHPVTVTLTDAAGSPAVFPLSEVIDLSMPASEQCPAVSGEKTPGTYGEVQGFLLDIAKGCPGAKTSVYSHNRSGSAARVCLEKRFNIMLTDASNQQDIRYETPGKRILLIVTLCLNLHYLLGLCQSISSFRRVRRGSSSPKFSPGLTPTGQTLSRFPTHLCHLFSTQLLM